MQGPPVDGLLLAELSEQLAAEGAGSSVVPKAGEGRVIVGEGIISAGKSYLIGKLVDLANSEGGDWFAIFERPDPKLLDLFYDHLDERPRNSYAFASQVSFLQSRILSNLQAQALAGKRNEYGNQWSPSKVVFTDRSMIGDGVFAIANRLLDGILPEEYEAYRSIRSSHRPLTQDVTLFLDVTPQRAKVLLAKRDNPYERNVPVWYLALLRRVYLRVLRDLALSGKARIALMRNEPFVTPEQALRAIERAPSVAATSQLWGTVDVDCASDESVHDEFERLHGLYLEREKAIAESG